MLPSSSFVRRLLLAVALPPLALIAVACSDEDELGASSSSGAGASSGGSGTGGAGGRASAGAGAAGLASGAGSAGTAGDPESGPPTVLRTYPKAGATSVSERAALSAKFSQPMDAKTLTAASFTVTLAGAPVAGTVSYFNTVATFVPDSPLALHSTYQATISVLATDEAGAPLVSDYSWSFATAATLALGPAPVSLGGAGEYAIVAKSAISNVPTSAITGNVALSPAAASYITGFALTKAGTRWTSPEVIGSLFAADNDPPTPQNLTTAIADMESAYTDAAGRPTPDFTNLSGGMLGGLTLAPGLYKWASSVTIPTDVTLRGAANDVWIFQITGDLELSAAKAMTLSGGAQPKNIFWQVAGAVHLETASHSAGIVLAKTAIVLGAGATMNGRLLAQTAVNIASSTVTEPTL